MLWERLLLRKRKNRMEDSTDERAGVPQDATPAPGERGSKRDGGYTSRGAGADLIILAEACIRYDKAIQKIGKDQVERVEVQGSGMFTVTGDDLDAIYEEWLSLARTAVGCICTAWPCEGLTVQWGLCGCKRCHLSAM